MPYTIRITDTAKKDTDNLSPKLRTKLYKLLVDKVAANPYKGEKLIGDLAGSYSIRLTRKDRVVYSVDEHNKTIYIEMARTHYRD